MAIMDGVTIMAFRGQSPRLAANVTVATGARLIGDLEIGEDSSIWFNAVVRADIHRIRIGERTNIQDNCTVHVTDQTGPVSIGSDVTVGHNAVIHACTVGDRCLIGMGAILLDGAVIGADSVVAAGSVVPPGKSYPQGVLIMGAPAKVIKELSDEEIRAIPSGAISYLDTKGKY